jgi:hypothetical protein
MVRKPGGHPICDTRSSTATRARPCAGLSRWSIPYAQVVAGVVHVGPTPREVAQMLRQMGKPLPGTARAYVLQPDSVGGPPWGVRPCTAHHHRGCVRARGTDPRPSGRHPRRARRASPVAHRRVRVHRVDHRDASCRRTRRRSRPGRCVVLHHPPRPASCALGPTRVCAPDELRTLVDLDAGLE